MKELTMNEVQEVNGGLRSILLGGVGAYLYEAAGGKDGIDRYLSNSWASMSGAVKYWLR